MFRPTDKPKSNVFDIVIGTTNELKWDPLWNFLHWLALENEGHGMGKLFQEKIMEFAFNNKDTPVEIVQEYGAQSNMWPDLAFFYPNKINYKKLIIMEDLCKPGGNTEKRERMRDYYNSLSLNNNNNICLIVLTNAKKDTEDYKNVVINIRQYLPNEEHIKILTLWEIGEWLSKPILKRHHLIEEFISWVKNR